MSKSSKPSKQRRGFFNKPLHLVGKDFSVHLSAVLRRQLGCRSVVVRKGDVVKVVRGDDKVKGKQGKVTSVLRSKRMVLVEGVVGKRGDGTERQIPLRPSNLVIVELNEEDSRRFKNKGKSKVESKSVKKGGK